MIQESVTFCDSKLVMVRQISVQVYIFIGLISFSISIILAIVVILKFFSRQFFGKSFKILLFLLIFLIIILNSILLITTISTQFVTYFHEIPCDNLFYTRDCLWAMYPNSIGIVGLVITQMALSVERYFASVKMDENRKESGVIGGFLAMIVLLTSSVIVYFLLDDVDPLEPNWHCAGFPISIYKKANTLYWCLITVDIFSLVIFAVVWKININCKQNGHYSISKTLHVEANLLVMHLFLPVVLIHFIMFSIHIFGMIIIRLLKDYMDMTTYSTLSIFFYIIPICTLIQLLLFLSILRKDDCLKKKNLRQRLEKSKNWEQHGNIYETGLNLQWNLAAEAN